MKYVIGYAYLDAYYYIANIDLHSRWHDTCSQYDHAVVLSFQQKKATLDYLAEIAIGHRQIDVISVLPIEELIEL